MKNIGIIVRIAKFHYKVLSPVETNAQRVFVVMIAIMKNWEKL